MRIFLVHKKSLYASFFKKQSKKTLDHTLLINHKTHEASVNKVQKALRKLGCRFRTILRTSRFSFRPDDFIITIGGDGTFLRTAHYVTKQKILGINSDPQHSVGALCSIAANDFEKMMREILLGHAKTQELTRMTITVNDKKLPVEPINDVLFANESPAATSRYAIKLRGKCEEQKSSGVWIAGPCGSTAGILAAGGKKQNYHDTRLQFLVREPFHGTASPYKLKKGFIGKTEKITLVNRMPKACLFLDGPARVVRLSYADKVVVKIAKNKLTRIL